MPVWRCQKALAELRTWMRQRTRLRLLVRIPLEIEAIDHETLPKDLGEQVAEKGTSFLGEVLGAWFPASPCDSDDGGAASCGERRIASYRGAELCPG
jgi:hypothetical protein